MTLSFVKRAAQVLAALLVAGISTESQATPVDPAVTFPSYPNDLTNGVWSLGFEFLANSAITVDELGIFDDGENNGSVHAVGIFDAEGNLLVSTDITQGTGYVHFFDWAPIVPFILAGGHDYYIAEETGTSNYSFAAYPFISVNPDISFVGSAYVASSTLVFPAMFDGLTWGYFGPNFSIGVPEPPTLPMFAVGLGLIGGAFNFGRRRSMVSINRRR